MAIDYKKTTKQFEQLHAVTEEYITWFASVCSFVAYPELLKDVETHSVPQTIINWIEQDAPDLPDLLLSDIKNNYADMSAAAAVLLDHLGAKSDRPQQQDFIKFKHSFEGFLNRLRRFEKDSAVDGSGIDELTGLRSKTVLVEDLKREMERVERQGNPFSLLLTQVDSFDEGAVDSVSLAVSVIKQCMRAFDDAYYMGDGEFLIMLKHADLIGAQSAVKRLQVALKSTQDAKAAMTMSYCIAEPIAEDKIDDLLSNMRQDLSDNASDVDAVIRLKELSPLERFVGGLD